MNERIKDILAQPVFERLNDWVNIGPVQRATLEEFAELIVKECILQIADVRIEHDFDPQVDEVLVQALSGIKKHFGVEE